MTDEMTGRRKIVGLDLATRCGYCIGLPGAHPSRSGSFRLKAPSEPVETALLNLFRFLEAEFKAELPALVIKEAVLPLQAFRDLGNSSANVVMQQKLHGTVELACRLFGVPCISVSVSTIRKHLLGRAKVGGDRKATKAAVVARCKLIGLIPRDASDDDDRADACAAFEYACAHHARRAPVELFMFGETA